MFRRVFLAFVLTAAATMAAGQPARGGPVSVQNPYRSFNISGVNYGSMRWERTHRSGPTRMHHRGGWLLRRR